MLNFIFGLEPWAKWLLTFGGLAVMIAAFFRWVLPKWRAAKRDARAIRDTLVGREPVVDSITGDEIKPAVPGIGVRMAHQEQQGARMEQQMTILTNAVADMASSQRRLDELEQRVTAIEQGHLVERLASRAENIHLFDALAEIAKGEDPTDPDHDAG